MKNFRNYLACLTVFALVFTSCSKDETPSGDTGEKATLSFGAIVNDLANKTSNKQSAVGDLPACSDDAAAYVHIVLLEGNTPVVGTTAQPYRVDLVPGQIFTEEDANLELDPGTYTLDHFSVYNAAGELLWIAPKGGVLAQFVDNALPLTIPLGAGVKKYVDVSVLCYDDRDVNQYGYQFFELDRSEWFEFCFFANYCAPNGRHFPAKFSVDISVNGVPLYTDRENVVGTNGDGDRFAEALCLPLPNIADFADNEDYIDYTITLLDWNGVYDATDGQVFSGSLSRDDIEANFDGPNNIDYEHFRFGCEDNGGGPIGGECPAGTDPDNDGLCGPTDPCPNVHKDNDLNNDCVPDGNEPCEDTDQDGVCNEDDDCPGYDDRADKDGDGIPDGCDPDTTDVLEGCETAFMEGNRSFFGPELNFQNQRWGWANLENDDENPTIRPLWAAAGQNDTSKGYHIGNVITTVDGTDVNVTIELFDGNSLDEVHIFFSNDMPTTTAPGQYGNNFDPSVDGLSYDFVDADGNFWLIVHADACPSED